MNDKIFSELCVKYQIPKHIPIRLPYENEKCYTGKTADFGMYNAMFAAGLRLSLMALHRQLVDYLGLSVSQIAPNAWRTFIWSRDTVGKSKWREPSAHARRVLLLLQASSHIFFQGDIPLNCQGEGLEVGVRYARFQ